MAPWTIDEGQISKRNIYTGAAAPSKGHPLDYRSAPFVITLIPLKPYPHAISGGHGV